MNKQLSTEIIKHIFDLVGININNENIKISVIDVLYDKFLIDKKIEFEDEDGNKYNNNIWGIEAKAENSIIKMLLSDLCENEISSEYILAIKLDTFPVQIIKLSYSDSGVNLEDCGIYINPIDNKWIESDITTQAKLLMGFEYLSSMFLEWKPISDHTKLYKHLVGFLNSNVIQ